MFVFLIFVFNPTLHHLPYLNQRERGVLESDASQGNETIIEISSNLRNVSSVRSREAGFNECTQKENEMQATECRRKD